MAPYPGTLLCCCCNEGETAIESRSKHQKSVICLSSFYLNDAHPHPNPHPHPRQNDHLKDEPEYPAHLPCPQALESRTSPCAASPAAKTTFLVSVPEVSFVMFRAAVSRLQAITGQLELSRWEPQIDALDG